jgi:UPF0716 protein FxsA|tara:strand:- start:81 stop:494 length:414 start_codon:yes stop_codon:yes gene_type:complete
MRKILILALILLPGFEIAGLIYLFSHYGWWFFGYLITMAILGWQLISEEKSLVIPRILSLINQGGSPITLLMGTAKNLLAGALFLFPGVLTDIIALFLLLIPVNEQSSKNEYGQKTNTQDKGDVIEGEFSRDDDDSK